jgi:hypothetical protein
MRDVVQFRRDPLARRRPPYLGPRIKWTMLIVCITIVVGYAVQHWWAAWVKQGLGW